MICVQSVDVTMSGPNVMRRSKGDLSDPKQKMSRNIVIRKPVRRVAYERKPVPVKNNSRNTTRNEVEDKPNESFKDLHYEKKSSVIAFKTLDKRISGY